MLGRLEYQKGNVEAALTVFEGIDVAAVIPRIKTTIVRRCELPRRHSQSDSSPPMSMHAVSLLIEAIFLKAKSLQVLGRYKGICFRFFTLYSNLCLTLTLARALFIVCMFVRIYMSI